MIKNCLLIVTSISKLPSGSVPPVNTQIMIHFAMEIVLIVEKISHRTTPVSSWTKTLGKSRGTVRCVSQETTFLIGQMQVVANVSVVNSLIKMLKKELTPRRERCMLSGS